MDINIQTGDVVREFSEPLFEYGDEQSFFSDGVSIGNTYNIEGVNYLLFMGWKAPTNGHWYGQIGRMIVNDNLTLELEAPEPFIALDDHDEISLSYPWVVKRDNLFKMWYGSTISWESENNDMIHVIKYAESSDGHNWLKKGIAIQYEVGIAQAFSRPTVWVDELGSYHMWYSYRTGDGTPYRIGYAISSDGVNWSKLHEQSKLGCSSRGWDSEMLSYPFVFRHLDELVMLYNGNGYGATGFGIAKKAL